MKKSLIVLAALSIAGTAQAAQLTCSGSYIGHTFRVSARTSGTQINGPVRLKVTGPFHNQEGDLTPSSSDIQAGRYVRFSGASADGSATLNANFRSGTSYAGVLAVSGQGGGGNVNVTCSLTGRGLVEDEMDVNAGY